jgi:hypothetical protein
MEDIGLDDKPNTVCELHNSNFNNIHESMCRIEASLETITNRQIEYMERQVKIESIVTNGLSSNIIAIKKQLDTFCEEVKTRLNVLESFSWFRNWMNELRDNLIKYILLIAIAGGVLFIVIYHGKELIKWVLR